MARHMTPAARAAMLADIEAGKMARPEIAAKHKVSEGTVYNWQKRIETSRKKGAKAESAAKGHNNLAADNARLRAALLRIVTANPALIVEVM